MDKEENSFQSNHPLDGARNQEGWPDRYGSIIPHEQLEICQMIKQEKLRRTRLIAAYTELIERAQ